MFPLYKAREQESLELLTKWHVICLLCHSTFDHQTRQVSFCDSFFPLFYQFLKGFPVADDAVRTFFLAKDARFSTRAKLERRFVHFFGALFHFAFESLESHINDLMDVEIEHSYEFLASTWRTYLKTNDNRTHLYRKVIQVSFILLKCFLG